MSTKKKKQDKPSKVQTLQELRELAYLGKSLKNPYSYQGGPKWIPAKVMLNMSGSTILMYIIAGLEVYTPGHKSIFPTTSNKKQTPCTR